MSNKTLPNSVRYVKNGKKGQWWIAAKEKGQIHLGWETVPAKLLLKPDFAKIERIIRAWFKGKKGAATNDFNALTDLLNTPSTHIWVTFQDSFMWWCTVHDGAIVNPDGAGRVKGHFWLECDRPWSNKSLTGKPLAISALPGTVTKTARFSATVCTPSEWEAILRIIHGKQNATVVRAERARKNYKGAILDMVKLLSPKDFEDLIDLVLSRSGWTRIHKVGGTTEGIDIEVENPATAEKAFVQIKSSATQEIFEESIARYEKARERYSRMIFAVHHLGN